MKRILNVRPSIERAKNWKASEVLGAARGLASSLPEKVDLREAWWSIDDQGQTGSCVGQASVDGVLRWHLVKAGKINNKTKMSVRFIWTASKETDIINDYPSTFLESEGTTLKAALGLLKKYGCVPEAILPFDKRVSYYGTAREFYKIANQYRISSYYQINQHSPGQIRKWLFEHGPILTWLPINDEFMRPSSTGLLTDTGGTNLGGHAVTIVGYDKDKFILRNSWGTRWGDKGFAYFNEKYLSAKFKECYGVVI